MKRINKFLALALTVAAVFSMTAVPTVFAEETYKVSGWRKTVTFDSYEDGAQFWLLTEFDKLPSLIDGRLYFWTLAEQKAVFEARTYNDVDVSADFGTINDHGKFDVGFYVHANGFAGAIDHVDGWNVNLERGASDNTFFLKLHRFQNNSWKGAVVTVSGLKLPMNKVHMRVVVKSGILYAFVNHETTPRITYEIGETAGYVGVRCFYSPNWVDNFSVVGYGNGKSFELDEQLNAANNTDTAAYTENTKRALDDAKEALQKADQAEDQYAVEDALKAFKKAEDGAIVKRSKEDFSAALTAAKAIENVGYTKNSWNSLQAVIAIAETIDANDEDARSYWTERLESKTALLVKYAKRGLDL